MTVETQMPSLLGMDDVIASIAERRRNAVSAVAEEAERKYQYVRPLTTAADGLIDYAQNPEGRFMLGIRDIDAMTRGFGRGELIYVTGRAHSGKTQVVLNAIANNPSKRVLLFTPDEVSELVLSKLISMHYNINAEEVEAEIKNGNQKTIDMVKRAAAHDFKNLLVIDDSLTLGQMSRAFDEAQDWWGESADLVVIDFLELIPGEEGADGVVSKSQALKRWTKAANVPVVCLHQASRSSGVRGKAHGMSAMRYGGETEAIMVLEVYRKLEDESLDQFDRTRHQNSLTVNLAKNKRPPSKKGEVDLFIHPDTGQIRPMRDEDMYVSGTPIQTAEQAMMILNA